MAGLECNLYFLDSLSSLFPTFLHCCFTFHQQPKTLGSASEWLVWWEVRDATPETFVAPMLKNTMVAGVPSISLWKISPFSSEHHHINNDNNGKSVCHPSGHIIPSSTVCFHRSTKLIIGRCSHLP